MSVGQLMPEPVSGEPQYRIKGLASGTVRAVREARPSCTAKAFIGQGAGVAVSTLATLAER